MVSWVLVIGLADLLIWRWQGAPYVVEGLLDEPAHAATGLLALTACGPAFDVSVVAAVLGGSLLIDVDHWPHVFGSKILEHGVPRPYTHSLGTIALVLALGLLLKGRKRELTLIGTLVLTPAFLSRCLRARRAWRLPVVAAVRSRRHVRI